MTYKEVADLVAIGMNFENNACIVGVAITGDKGVDTKVCLNGDDNDIKLVVSSIISGYIEKFKNKDVAVKKAYELEDVILNCITEIRSVENDKR